MSLALYRKYRPQRFKDVSGQTHIKTTLQNELEMDRVSHAYIFSGPRGTGKTTMARLMAKSVNCIKRKKGESEPCSGCDSCLEISEGRSIDVIEIDAASHTGVDNVRDNIIQNARFSPTLRKYKVFIIDEVHMLSISAFNALLKTLEEPPKHAIFILATTELHKIPSTILSRCQQFDFRKVNIDEVIKRLEYIIKSEERSVEKEVLDVVAKRSEGCMRDAESLLGQILSISGKNITVEDAKLVMPYTDFGLVLEFISYLKEKKTNVAITFINKIMNEGVDLNRFLDDTIEAFRKILLTHLNLSLDIYTSDMQKSQTNEILRLAKDFQIKDITSYIEILLLQRNKMSDSPIFQLPLELAIIEMSAGLKNVKTDIIDKSKPDIIKNIPIQKKEIQIKKDIPLIIEENDKKENNASLIEISINTIKDKWNDILLKTKEYNHTLFSFIRLNSPVAINKNTLQLAVNYSFHKERIDDMKNKMAIEKILEEIFNTRIRVECVIIERKETEIIRDDSDVEALAQEFGGSVIE